MQNAGNSKNNINVNLSGANNDKMDMTDKFVASILTFKEDIPNHIRRLGYILIIISIILNSILGSLLIWKLSDIEESVSKSNDALKSKVIYIYNKQRDILKKLEISTDGE